MNGVQASKRRRVERSGDSGKLGAQLHERHALEQLGYAIAELPSSFSPNGSRNLDGRQPARDPVPPVAEKRRQRRTFRLHDDELDECRSVQIEERAGQLDPAN